jgi:hypothetical protein
MTLIPLQIVPDSSRLGWNPSIGESSSTIEEGLAMRGSSLPPQVPSQGMAPFLPARRSRSIAPHNIYMTCQYLFKG